MAEALTRRLFLGRSVAAGVIAPAVASSPAAAAPRQVREVMEELEALIAQQTGVSWSVMLMSNETMMFNGEKALPVVSFDRCDGVGYWDDDWGVLQSVDVGGAV